MLDYKITRHIQAVTTRISTEYLLNILKNVKLTRPCAGLLFPTT